MHTTTSPQTPQPGNSTSRTSKKGVAVGLTAGLVGGSLAGLMLGLPGLTSAASDIGATPAAAAVVQQTDEPATDVPAADAPVERGERLRELLQALVDDGTLTSDQADSVTTHLIENRPERGDRGDRGGHGRRGPGTHFGSGVLADVFGIEADDLREQLRSGSTLAEIAEANGVETSAVIDALVGQAEERINAAVDAGRFTADEGAEKLAEIETRITDKINGN